MKFDTEMQFVIGGKQVGCSFITVEDGRINTEAAEEQFWAVLRKSSGAILKDAEEAEHEKIIDALTPAQEEKLKEEHAKGYTGLDDDMTDAYEDYLLDLSIAELKKIIG